MKRITTGILLLILLVSGISAVQLETSKEQTSFSEMLDSTRRILESHENKYYKKSQLESPHEGVEKYEIEHAGSDTCYPSHKTDNPIMKSVIATIEHHAPSQVRIKITDEKETRWEVPNHFPFPNFGTNSPTNDGSDYRVEIQNEPFGFAVIRKSTEEALFDTRPYNLIYSDLLIDLTSSIPTNNLFGLGERSSRFKMGPDGTYSIWARDKPEVIDRGVSGGHVYGHHPVYLMKEKSGNWHIVLFRSSNAMDVTMDQGKTVRFRVAGGIVDIVVFLGGKTPESAIEQYHEYVGHWALMPFWSMGFHQSRWGYANLNVLKDKVNRYREMKAPIDVIWSDLDYMIDKEDFTINSAKFPFDEFNRWLKEDKIHWVPIIDAGVSRRYRNEQGYDEGIKRDVFIKNKDGNPMLGTVWPGDSHYVDWFHPEANKYWGDMIERLYTHVKFSGIWLDMNEPTNFANGEVGREWERSRYDDLPYTPGNQPLKTMTISMDGKHHGGIDEFNVHDLFGTLESRATYEYLKTKSPLPFILTRSSAFGAGQFAAHWTGDNGASWEFMKYGTTGVFQFGIFGMPFTGADICGFMGSTTPELCARWFQSGLLYPFARNHNHLEAIDQEAFAFHEENVRETALKAIQLRYSILKWYYAQFIEKKGKGLVFKPLFFEFPDDETLLNNDYDYIDEQLMLGRSLMAVPVYQPGKSVTKAYFPAAKWFNYFTGEVVHDSTTEGAHIDVACPLGDYVPLFIRAGSIISKQDIQGVQWSADLHDHFTLVVAFEKTHDGKYEAKGTILGLHNYSDTEVQNKCVRSNCIIDIKAVAEKNDKALKIKVGFHPRDFSADLEEQTIDSIVMYGLPNGKENKKFGGQFSIQGTSNFAKKGIAEMDYDTKKGLIFNSGKIPTKAGAYLDLTTEYVE